MNRPKKTFQRRSRRKRQRKKIAAPPAPLERVYLETAAAIHLFSGQDGPQPSAFAGVYELLRQNSERQTGRFVLLELAAGYLSYVAFVYNRARVAGSMKEFNRAFADGRLNFAHSKRNGVLAVQRWLIDRYFEPATQQADWQTFQTFALRALLNHIRLVWRQAERIARQQVFDCHPDLPQRVGKLNEHRVLDEEVSECGGQGYDCGAGDGGLLPRLRALLKACRGQLADAGSDKKEVVRRIAALQELLDADPSERMNTARCRRIGDAFVALECPPDHTLVTPNGKHYEALCRKLKLGLRTYSTRP